MVHFLQMYNAKDCAKYDYGSTADNMKHYGTPTPPAYNITSITNTPVSLFWGQNDTVADPEVCICNCITWYFNSKLLFKRNS